jgi:hypothetical protein
MRRRTREIEKRRDVDARDRAAGRGGIVDGPLDPSPVRGGGRCLAAGGQFDRRDAMAAAFANAGVKPGPSAYAEPDWAAVHREMRRKHVTLSIL